MTDLKTRIQAHLSGDYPWKDRLLCFDSLGSTNDTLKKLAREGAPEGTVVIAAHQTNGHGRLGRSFQSPEGQGVYLSLLLRPDCQPKELMHLTCAAGTAMCDAVETAARFRPGIKWTNDLVYDRRKLGGILTELGFAADGKVAYAIVGIGINCLQSLGDFPPDIRDMAASLTMVSGNRVEPERLAAAMVQALWHMNARLLTGREEMLARYRRDCITIGQEISLVRPGEVSHGRAVDVDEAGALIVEFPDGHIAPVASGEVSARGMYGYI